MIPGWMTTTRFARSISRIRSIRGEARSSGRPRSRPRRRTARCRRRAARSARGARAASRTSVGDLGGRRRAARRPAAGPPGGRRSRRGDTPRGRPRRSAGARPGRRAGSPGAGPRRASGRDGSPVEADAAVVATGGSLSGRLGHGPERCRPALASLALLVVLASACPRRPWTPSPRRPSAGFGRRVAAGADGVRPGSVNATIDGPDGATTTPTVTLNCGTRSFRVSDDDRGPQHVRRVAIDRLELNTIVARLGGMRDHGRARSTATPSSRRVSDQTIHRPARRDPRRRARRRSVRVRYRATLRSTTWPARTGCSPGPTGSSRPVPLAARGSAGRPPFNRPNHGDPFVTAGQPARSGSRIVSDRRLVLATTGDQVAVSADGADADLRGPQRARLRGHRGDRLPDRSRDGRRRRRPRLVPARASRRRRCSAPRSGALEPRGGPARAVPVPDLQGRPVGRRLRDGVARAHLDPDRARRPNLRYLVAHETAHQWFYGIVGNDQARQPFADEAAADFVARYVLGLRRASAAARPPGST